MNAQQRAVLSSILLGKYLIGRYDQIQSAYNKHFAREAFGGDPTPEQSSVHYEVHKGGDRYHEEFLAEHPLAKDGLPLRK